MAINIAFRQASTYQVTTAVFAGPLDLLLQLIEREELDITRLSLAQVTDQYLAHIQNIQDLQPEEVSAFLLIAAKLIQIKSEALLPVSRESDEEEADIGEALTQQLINYRRYKLTSDLLAQRQEDGLHTYLRMVPTILKPRSGADLHGITMDDLIAAAYHVFSQSHQKEHIPNLGTVIRPHKVTVREKIQLIYRLLKTREKISFLSLFEFNVTRTEVLATFLALLELVKRHYVNAQQTMIFGDILIEFSQSWDLENGELDLEFE
jgi:segregation and condensation protein A